jgi:diguanylate cyclase (GGDEF)-like protein/PAS domain S-box-containing protein
LARARVTEPYGYILKPFQDRELYTAIELALYKHAAEQRIKESEQRFRLLADTAPVMIWMTNTENQCTYLNKGWLEFRGRTMEQELNLGWLDGVHPDDQTRLSWLLSEVMPKRAEFHTEYRLQRADSVYRWVLETGVPRLVDGVFDGYIGSCFDITERKQAEEQLRYLSTHDQLTGLCNRTFFEEWATRLEHSRLFPVSAIMLDMDGLKLINDTHGHAMGDALLQHLALMLTKCFRAEDIIARIGGDEFAVWLPETDEATATQMITRVHNSLAKESACQPAYPLKVSMGAATALQPGSLREILKLADARMYQAKHAAKLARERAGT